MHLLTFPSECENWDWFSPVTLHVDALDLIVAHLTLGSCLLTSKPYDANSPGRIENRGGARVSAHLQERKMSTRS